MSEEQKPSNLILVAAASAAISGGGTHIVTSSDDVTSANIEDCRSFSEHAREHAKNLNRKFIGIELDENYFNIAQERIGV